MPTLIFFSPLRSTCIKRLMMLTISSETAFQRSSFLQNSFSAMATLSSTAFWLSPLWIS